MRIHDMPMMAGCFDAAADSPFSKASVYVCKETTEDRSRSYRRWCLESGTKVLQVIGESDGGFGLSGDAEFFQLHFRSPVSFSPLWEFVGNRRLIIDMTGLEHAVWAALLREAVRAKQKIDVTYVTPGEYRQNRSPTEGALFDLSRRFRDIKPLPGFARIGESNEMQPLVALLGFEGPRFSHVLDHVDPNPEQVYPVIGVPGFELEYPFHTYLGNRLPLSANRVWKNVKFLPAYCPFSMYWWLSENDAFRSSGLKIAPLGTKPQALGAILFCIQHPTRTELIYDHPVRSDHRTSGVGRAWIYRVSQFLGLE